MRRDQISIVVVITALAAILVGLSFYGPGLCKSREREGPVRMPAVAGAFYPAGKGELGSMIDSFLAKANPPEIPGSLVALVLPHAGYVYSGQVAAYGYKELVGKRFDTVIIMCDSHRARFDGVAVYPAGSWETPLGDVPVDAALAKKLVAASPRIRSSEEQFKGDHTLEVQLPFLQKTLKDFQIVPILFGNSGGNDYEVLARAILENAKDKDVLVIASSDLSHYPNYKDAKVADRVTIDGILSGDVSTFERDVAKTMMKGMGNLATCACGADSIKTAMLVAKGESADKIVLLDAANSGDVSGERGRVVGYASIGFFSPGNPKASGGEILNKEEQGKLLKIAKETVVSFVTKGRVPEFTVTDPALKKHLGAFVTLKANGRLRGCIGSFSPTTIPLYQVVTQMAVAAASQDMRFSPVKGDELEDLTFEISVLSEPKRVASWKEIVLGRDGVIIEKGWHKGVFLPQVATDHNMTIDQFLGELCAQKAGLPRDCYKQNDVELYTFTAQVFEEHK